MINRSEILRDAWKRYRRLATVRFGAPFSRTPFALQLRTAWAAAKREAERADALAAPVPAYPTHVDTPREREILSEWIDTGSRVDWTGRDALTAELNRIAW
jgi:hypothetical protein